MGVYDSSGGKGNTGYLWVGNELVRIGSVVSGPLVQTPRSLSVVLLVRDDHFGYCN